MASNVLKLMVILGSVFLSLFVSSSAQNQTCISTSLVSNKLYTACNDLPYLSSSLYWNYDLATGNLQMAFRHVRFTPSKWVSWAINPDGLARAMFGAQALVAYQQPNGSLRVYKSNVMSSRTSLEESDLRYPVSNLNVSLSNGEITISANWQLPPNTTHINQVWQEGPVNGNTLGEHPQSTANTQSKGSLNIVSGQSQSAGGSSTQRNRNIHGLINGISWGILMPMGVMSSRYLKAFKSADPAWFYIHVTCQTSAYIIGVAGWATGLKLGSESGLDNDTHKTIGLILFIFATLQVFALLLRPNKDHKYRFYWNIYHHSIGYAVIILSIFNIFEGFEILNPKKTWKNTYVGIIIALAIISSFLEAYTWFIYLKMKKIQNARKQGLNGANGLNGYGGRA